MSLSHPGSRVRRRMGPAQSDGLVAVVIFFYYSPVVAVVTVDFALLLPFSLLLSLLSAFLGCLRSYNCCIDINL